MLSHLCFWMDSGNLYQTKTHLRTLLKKPRPQYDSLVTIGSSDAYLSLERNTHSHKLCVFVYFSEDQKLYQGLFQERSKFLASVGKEGEWLPLPGKKLSVIQLIQMIKGDRISIISGFWRRLGNWLKPLKK